MDESASGQGIWVGWPRRAESAFHPKIEIARRGENLQGFLRFRVDFESFLRRSIFFRLFNQLGGGDLYQACTDFAEETL